MAFNLKSNIDPVHVPVRPLKGMVSDTSPTLLTPGNFVDLSNYWVTKKGIKKRNGFSSFGTNTALPVEDQPIISIAPVWKTDGNQFAAVLTSRYLYSLTGYSFSTPVYWLYNSGECSVSGSTVTGYGTDWSKETNYILPGDYINFLGANAEQIEYGDCEDAVNGPTLSGTSFGYQALWNRTADQFVNGSYSWVTTKTSASGTEGWATLHINILGMLGLTAGNTYRLSFYLFLEANNLTDGLLIFRQFYTGEWHETHKYYVESLEAWEFFQEEVTINANTTAVDMRLKFDNDAVPGTKIYIDDLSMNTITEEEYKVTSILSNNTLELESSPGGLPTPTNYITYGDCENTSSPTLDGGTSGLAGGTWARSIVRQKSGLYSWLLTKTAAATVNPVVVYLTDNTNTTDMHGLTAGTTYTLSLWMWTDVAAAASTTVKFQEYYSGSWHDTVTITPDNLSTWDSHDAGPIFESVTLNASTTGVTIELRIDTAEAAGKLLYIDDIAFVADGLSYEIRRRWNIDDTTLLDWAVVDGKLVIADHKRPLTAYDGATYSIYDAAVTYVPSCVAFFADRLWMANTIEDGNYYFQRIRWSSPTDRTSFDAADYIDLPYTSSPIQRLVPLGRYLVAYCSDSIFIGSLTSIPYQPYVFRAIETGNRGLLGVRAVTSTENGHFFPARDDVFFLTAQGIKALNCPVAEEMIESCSDGRRIYAVTDHHNNRVVFGFPTTGKYIEKLWSFHYKTGEWSYDDVSATSIANPLLDLGLAWDDLSTVLPVDTWDGGMTVFSSWDSISTISMQSNSFYRMESGEIQVLSTDSGTDVNGNFTTTWITGDLDFNEPNKDKTYTCLYLKLAERPQADLSFNVACSYNGGYTWQHLGLLTVTTGVREGKLDFIVTGSAIRFRLMETSTVFGYIIIELGYIVRGRGKEIEFD